MKFLDQRDGIWEYITSEECVNIVKNFYENNLDAVGAINAIIKEAFNRWKKYDEIIDDITAIIIFFDDNQKKIKYLIIKRLFIKYYVDFQQEFFLRNSKLLF